YKEVFLYLRGDLSYEATVALIKQKTRNYAKRQLTWFRKDSRVRWLELSAGTDSQSRLAALADEIVELLNRETKFA
ncbi:MAG: tRNA (adenosine(37)-N6)-dimethylallyltransferase MiaA, partial [Calditrichaeota bacterium]